MSFVICLVNGDRSNIIRVNLNVAALLLMPLKNVRLSKPMRGIELA